MTCLELVVFLTNYLDGTLSEDVRKAFEGHLAVCPNCVAYLNSYQQTIQLSRSACISDEATLPEKVPEEMVHAILASIGRSADES
jgi:anti-sigma factor RsiW